jgi:beta-glucosidase
VVTDYTGIPEMIAHGMEIYKQCALALKLELKWIWLVKALTTLKKSLNENKVSIEQIMQF